MLLLIWISFLGLVEGNRNPTPSVDLLNLPGDSPPYIPIHVGYPAQGPFKLAVYLDYDISWLYSKSGEKSSKNLKNSKTSKCFNENKSTTFTFGDKTQKSNGSNSVATDLLRIGNSEYEFHFGLVRNQCSRKNAFYSGIFGLGPTLQTGDIQISLQKMAQPTVSFFLPSYLSQQQSKALIFGVKTHPACSYNNKQAVSSISRTQWVFPIRCCNAYHLNTTNIQMTGSLFIQPKIQNVSFAMDLEDMYGPVEQVFGIYKMLGARRLKPNSERYYIPCNNIPKGILSFDFFENSYLNQDYRFEAKHLVTQDSRDKTKCLVNVRTGGRSSTDWIFGKKFMERFCVTFNLSNNEISLGTVYDTSQYEIGEKLSRKSKH